MLAGKITEEDEEDILAELDAITNEMAEAALDQLPSVPVTSAAAKAVEEDGEEVEEVEEEEPEVRTRQAVAI